jgi:uncharacterized delta-60 repeat protein
MNFVSHRCASLLGVLLALLVFSALATRAQSALDGFDPNANGTVQVVVVQPDGKILIGGDFTALSPNGGAAVTRNRIARLNSDGTLDTAFDPNADATVYAIALQADGNIVVGGSFNTIGGQTRHRIARLDATTGLADSFDPNANGFVRTLAIQADGKILVGGGIQSIGGQARNYIARLDPTTGLADSFDAHSESLVLTIVVQADGKILVGGGFAIIGGQTRNRIARLDPVTAAADAFDPNAIGLVEAIAVQADGKVLVGGTFSQIGGQIRTRIARLDAVTGAPDSFNPNANDQVLSIAVQPDGKILVGGGFTTIGGQARNHIARLDAITGLADSFDPNASGTINSIAVQQDGKVLAGGGFTSVSPNGGASMTRNNIARAEKDGRLDQTLDLNLTVSVSTFAVQPDGKIVIGGGFTTVLGQPRNYIARINSDGSLDMTFDPNANAPVRSIAVQRDGRILVGGDFSVIGGQTRISVARLDGSTGLADSFDPNIPTQGMGQIDSIAVQSDGKILVAGPFGTVAGQPRRGVARLDAETGLPDSFAPNPNGTANSVSVQPDGKILVSGFFNTVDGQVRTNIARFDPVTGMLDSFAPQLIDPSGFPNAFTTKVQSDGKVLAGGVFTGIGGALRKNIGRVDAVNGFADSFDPNPGGGGSYVASFAVQSDGKVLAGGNFPTIGGQARRSIARLDSVTGSADSFDAMASADGGVGAFAVLPDGRILVCGGFMNIGGQPRKFFARLTNDTAALQTLAVTRTGVTWTLGGSSPQLTRVTFEYSTDSVNYVPLGNAIVSGNKWSLTGLNLQTGQNIYVRARGYYQTGGLGTSGNIMESVKNAYLASMPSISGTLTYGNAIGMPTPRFVPNVLINADGSVPVSTSSSSNGTYSLSGFGSGSYTVTPTKTSGVNGSISSFDAGRIAQHAAGINMLTGNQLIVADVSGNGTISSFDAGQIARYAAGLQGSGSTGNWVFMPVSRNYASVTGNITGEDFVALLMGEVSGNWMNTGQAASGK